MNISTNDIFKSNIPKKIHNYELQNEICELPCGFLYLGLNNYINEKVYIKVYDKILMFTSFNLTGLINNEIFILKLLNHKNILQLYEYIESETYIFIIYEYFNGESLKKYLTNKNIINDNTILKIFYDIINVMDYIHSMNICHLNINLESILIDEDNNIKFINFEYACFYKENIQKEIKDNINYIFSCPEMLANQYFSPEKADVYSCGILLYYLIIGNLPFQSDKRIINEELVMKGEYNMPTYIRNSIQNLIFNMLAINSDERCTFEDIINCEWFNENKNILDPIPVNQGINILKQKYPIDDNILKLCDNYEMNISAVSRDIKNNIFNFNSSTYKQFIVHLNEKNIPTINDYESQQYNDYVNDEDHFYSIEQQIKRTEKDENKEIEKNNKIMEIENNFYSNGFKIYEELKKIKLELEKQNNIINNNANSFHDNDLVITKNNLKNSPEKNKEKTKKQRNAKKKVTIKEENNYPLSPKYIPRRKKYSFRKRRPKGIYDIFVPKRKRFFSTNEKNYEQEKYGLEDINKDKDKDLLFAIAKKRRISLLIKLNKNKFLNFGKKNIQNNLNDMYKDIFTFPARKRIYSMSNKKKNNSLRKYNNNKNIKNNTFNKNKEQNNEEDPSLPKIKKRILTTFAKIVKKKNKENKENKENNTSEFHSSKDSNDEEQNDSVPKKKWIGKSAFNDGRQKKFSKYKIFKTHVEELTIEGEKEIKLNKNINKENKPKRKKIYKKRKRKRKRSNEVKVNNNEVDIFSGSEDEEAYFLKYGIKKERRSKLIEFESDNDDDFEKYNTKEYNEGDHLEIHSDKENRNNKENHTKNEKEININQKFNNDNIKNKGFHSGQSSKSSNRSNSENDLERNKKGKNADKKIFKGKENDNNKHQHPKKENMEKEKNEKMAQIINNDLTINKKQSMKDKNNDFFQTKVIPKQTKADFENNYQDLYETTGNKKSMIKKEINNKNRDSLSKKKEKYENEELINKENRFNNSKITGIRAKYYNLAFGENKGLAKNKIKNIQMKKNFFFPKINHNKFNVTESTIKGNQSYSFDVTDESKPLSFHQIKNITSIEEDNNNDVNAVIESQIRNSLRARKVQEQKVKIKKFIEKTDYNYLDYTKKPKNKVIYKSNKRSKDKSKDSSHIFGDSYYDYYFKTFSKEISKNVSKGNSKDKVNKKEEKRNKSNNNSKNNSKNKSKNNSKNNSKNHSKNHSKSYSKNKKNKNGEIKKQADKAQTEKNDKYIYNFKTKKVLKKPVENEKNNNKKKSKEKEKVKENKNQKIKEKQKQAPHQKNNSVIITSNINNNHSKSKKHRNNSNNSNNRNNKKIKNISTNEYYLLKNRNIIDALSSKQSSNLFNTIQSDENNSKNKNICYTERTPN